MDSVVWPASQPGPGLRAPVERDTWPSSKMERLLPSVCVAVRRGWRLPPQLPWKLHAECLSISSTKGGEQLPWVAAAVTDSQCWEGPKGLPYSCAGQCRGQL